MNLVYKFHGGRQLPGITLQRQLNGQESMDCYLFFATPDVDSVMKMSVICSGFLAHYN